jgi:hypothetical protein
MQFVIKLEEPDILTYTFGENIAIQAGNMTIVFSPAAIDEFIADVQNIKAGRLEGYIPPSQLI